MSKAVAYTDGSYNKKTGNYGCGVVLIIDGGNPIRMHSTGRAEPDENGWQVNGEINAAVMAVKKAIELGCSEITIYHDYEGVGKWPDGRWKTKKTYTRIYALTIRQLRKRIRITFRHVKGHAGNEYNEMADQEAKIGAGLVRGSAESVEIAPEPPIEEPPVRSIPKGLNEEGRRNLIRFRQIEEPSFRDFMELKTGGMDCFSRMRIADLEAALGAGVCKEIRMGIHDSNDYAAAVRWAARGLSAEDAAHKVNVDHEVRDCAMR